MKLNTASKFPTHRTAEGAPARRISPLEGLRRSVMSCLLWEDAFYVDGISVAERISEGVRACDPKAVYDIAVEARNRMKLRHVPLLLAREMARHPSHRGYVAALLQNVIQRPDELAEYVAIYWKDGKCPLSAQSKKGLALAFNKFSEYSLAKYNREGAVTLRDVLFLCHAKPNSPEQQALWQRLIDGKLATPDTWEVALSGGEDKKAAWTRLLSENKLGALALLRNLRNMLNAGVPHADLSRAIQSVDPSRVLPFRFLSAAKHAPALEPSLEGAMLRALESRDKLSGETLLLVDVSGSMDAALSRRSELTRVEAASALAILLREVCDSVRIMTFSQRLVEVPARRGFALGEAIHRSQSHSGTYLGRALTAAKAQGNWDRVIVVTDEQSADAVPGPGDANGYMVNVSTEKNGVGYGGAWVHLDGWSEALVDFIVEMEKGSSVD